MFRIAIDGPSGSGKSTIAKIVSEKLNINYLDTGAMYRMVTLYMLEKNIDVKSEKNVIEQLHNINIEVSRRENADCFYLNKKDVTEKIRTQDVTKKVSNISKIPEVRKFLITMQKDISKKTSLVMDGRDIGTVVIKDAEVKIYLDASLEERAKRRYNEQKEFEDITFESVYKDMKKRDEMDNEVTPLIPADDAIFIDSTKKTINEVVDEIIKYTKEVK